MSDFLSGILGRAFGGAGRGGASGMGGALKVAAAALVLQQLMKHFGGRAGAEQAAPPPPAGGSPTTTGGGGVLGDLFGGGGGAAGGAGLGGLLGGLDGMLGRLRGQGMSREVDSWVSTGPNAPVAPRHLESAFDPAEVDAVARQAGTDRGTLLEEVSRLLPDLVDRMTPGGRVPRDPGELEGGGLSGLLAGLFGGGAGPQGEAPDREPTSGAMPPGGAATGRGAGGEAGMPRFSDDPPGPGQGSSASGPGGPPLPRGPR